MGLRVAEATLTAKVAALEDTNATLARDKQAQPQLIVSG